MIDEIVPEPAGGAHRYPEESAASLKAAIKKHHPLTPELAQRLIEDLMACAVPHTCPHGRPTLIQISYAELEKKFGRKV